MRQFQSLSIVCLVSFTVQLEAAEPHNLWPSFAPGETTKLPGELQPFRKNEVPRVSRVTKITQPTYTIHLAEKPNGSAVVILPGGGFGKVVPDKEGTELADVLNKNGVSAFVLSYRTKMNNSDLGWPKALQDAQRMMKVVRVNAAKWKIDLNRIGLVAFSAGGQVGARLLCDGGKLAYHRLDAVDDTSHRPDFAVLVYPWNIYDPKADSLIDGVRVPKNCPPTFLVHTDDDRSSSLGSVLFYAALKRHRIPAELHVYGNGGHGYGLRQINGSQISTWTEHAIHWINRQPAKK